MAKKKVNQDEAMQNCLQMFLKDFDMARYVIDNPVERLEKYFKLLCDKKGTIHITAHTVAGDIELGNTSDIDLADLQNVIYWLRNRAKNYLWFNCNINA